jgi:hypothetical protein
VTVVHELTRLPARSGKSCAVDCVIETPLEQEKEVFTRDPLHAGSALEIVSELSFKDEVDALNLLLFAQLLAITDQRLAATHRVAVLSWRLCTAFFNRTRRLKAPVTFKKKLCTFAAAQAAHRISIPSQLFSASSLCDGKVYRLRW